MLHCYRLDVACLLGAAFTSGPSEMLFSRGYYGYSLVIARSCSGLSKYNAYLLTEIPIYHVQGWDLFVTLTNMSALTH